VTILSPSLIVVHMKKHLAIVTAKPVVNQNSNIFLSK